MVFFDFFKERGIYMGWEILMALLTVVCVFASLLLFKGVVWLTKTQRLKIREKLVILSCGAFVILIILFVLIKKL